MLMVPHAPEFQTRIYSHAGQPVGNNGATVTPGNNTYGSYATVIAGASVTDDVYGIRINFNSIDSAGLAKDCIATIGFDAAGGTSFTDEINHLYCSCAASVGAGGTGISYYFPLFIKAGTSIGCKMSVNNATVDTGKCFVELYCRPAYPAMFKTGSFVRTFGATTASSSGTAVTPGQASEGAWSASLGTLAETLWFWQVGFGINDSTMATRLYHVDVGVGDATNKRVIIENAHFTSIGVAETLINTLQLNGGAEVASGANVYARVQASNTPDSNNSCIVYGVGG